ncbi:MAG: hypothetical protein Q7W13_12190 [Bacteroidia bacterium]|nr:hypothetical protein [Bacteroidia bacterium]
MSRSQYKQTKFTENTEYELTYFLVSECIYFDNENLMKYSAYLKELSEAIEDLKDNSNNDRVKALEKLQSNSSEIIQNLMGNIKNSNKKTL